MGGQPHLDALNVVGDQELRRLDDFPGTVRCFFRWFCGGGSNSQLPHLLVVFEEKKLMFFLKKKEKKISNTRRCLLAVASTTLLSFVPYSRSLSPPPATGRPVTAVAEWRAGERRRPSLGFRRPLRQRLATPFARSSSAPPLATGNRPLPAPLPRHQVCSPFLFPPCCSK